MTEEHDTDTAAQNEDIIITKTERLNALFTEWKEQKPAEEAKRMCLDGIVCEERYDNTNPKILFIAKEPNMGPEEPGSDFREWWGDGEVKYAFSLRLCEWAYGIWNGFPPLEQYDALVDSSNIQSDTIRSIAFMNLKKVGGGGTADAGGIKAATEANQCFLQRQISIINPDVIVGGIGIGNSSSLWKMLFPDIGEFQPSGFDIKVAHLQRDTKVIRVIDFFHPSYPVSRAMQYCLLGRVFGSEKYCALT